MIPGLDFGTTNSGAAVYDGRTIRLLPVDPAGSAPNLSRTAIYITRSGDYYLGSAALNLYFNQNIGRPTRYRKIKVGEIMQTFAEIPTFYRDVFVYEDEFSPGRLFLSIKTGLRNPHYHGTVFLKRWYSPSDLAAIFLIGMKQQIDRGLPAPGGELVLGRPVRFSTQPDEDKIAQSRLLEAAFKAGFEKVYLEYEPVAAALAYERTIQKPETVLVFDFGGGTLDFTVMEIGGGRRRILATGGIPVAGDVFDQRLFRVTVPRHLGENDEFVAHGKRYPIPAHLFDLLSSPQELVALNTPENQEMLRSIHLGAVHPHKTAALLQMVSSNYALYLFDLVEQAKRRLSAENQTTLEFNAGGIAISERVSRARFEQAIRQDAQDVRSGIDQVLRAAGLRRAAIDRVIRTGGSSQIPLFVELLERLFGAQKVLAIDTFSSVTAGLAIRGWEIEHGLSSLPGFTPEQRTYEAIAGPAAGEEASSNAAQPADEVEQIDLQMVSQRLAIDAGRAVQPAGAAAPARLFGRLCGGSLLLAPAGVLQDDPAPAPSGGEENCQPFLLETEQSLLAVTNHFKLISVSAESLWHAMQFGEQGLRDLLRLESGENCSALLPWNPAAPAAALVCLVTQGGQARAFPANLLAAQLHSKPYYQLERRYQGNPAALIAGGEDDVLLLATSNGRAAAANLADLRVFSSDLLRPRPQEWITTALACPPGSQVYALSDQAAWLPVLLDDLPTSGPASARAKYLRRNFKTAALWNPGASRDAPLAYSSHGRMLTLAPPNLAPRTAAPTAAGGRAARLHSGEVVLGLLNQSEPIP